MWYRVRYVDPVERRVLERALSAADEAAARREVSAGGAVVLSLQVQGATARRGRVDDVNLLCRELMTLVRAGLTVVEALEALALTSRQPDLIQAVLAALSRGKSLSGALSEAGGVPPLLVASVRASERTGDLPHALEAYLHFADMMGGLRGRLISAALYPAIVTTLGMGIALFLLMVVVPRFAKFYGDSLASASLSTRAILWASQVLSQSTGWVIGGLALMAVAGLAAWRSGALGRGLRGVANLWPWLANQLLHFELSRLYEALALLVRGGYSLHEALGVVGGLAMSPDMQQRVSAARGLVELGRSASAALTGAGLSDPISHRLLQAGERGGDFERVLQAVAARHRAAFDLFVERATRVAEPLLLLGVALLVGGMVVTLYLPIFDIAGALQ